MSEERCNPYECPMCKQFEDFRKETSEKRQKIWEALNELKTNDAVQNSKYDTILNKLNEVTMEVKALQAVPANNWKDLVKTVLSTVVSLIIGFALAKLF